MKLQRILPLLLAAVLVFSLGGCSKKDFAAITLTDCVLEQDETKTLTPFLPDAAIEEPVTLTLTPVTDAGLVASYTDGVLTTESLLTLTGVTPGSYTLTFTQTAKGYNDSTATMQVTVNEPPPPALEAVLSSQLLGLNTSIPPKEPLSLLMESGVGAELMLSSREKDFTITAESSSPCLEVKVNEHYIMLVPVEAGTATLTITIAHPAYTATTVTCPVEVAPPHTRLVLADGAKVPVMVSQGQSATIPLAYDGALSFLVEPAHATAAMQNGKAMLTGVAEGSGTVTVTATQAGFGDSTLTVAFTVTAAPPPVVEATTSGKYAELEQEILQYINAERAAIGAPALKMNAGITPAARVRAQETAESESHTRPDGRRGLSVFDDYKLTRYNIIGENLAGADYRESGDEVVKRWMESPSHRSALLDERFSDTGVGVYYDGEVYRYCQLFGGVVTQ